ncbi:MAG: glycosyltransferase [Phycisphaerae bacterium]
MRVLMLGWEFPPHISGGLGTACYGMTKGLSELGVGVCFVLPTAVPASATSHVALRSPTDVRSKRKRDRFESEEIEHVEFRRVEAALQAYSTPESYAEEVRRREQRRKLIEDQDEQQQPAEPQPQVGGEQTRSFVRGGGGLHYDGDLMGQVHRYARLALEVSEQEQFDVVHAHDWMTYPAALAVAAARGKPLVVHVHSTEFDRSGEHINQQVYDVERTGMHGATRVVCVSQLTKSIVTSRYGVDPAKCEVVHNAVELPIRTDMQMKPISRDEKIVLFLGRITMQKGPEYFLQAAKKVIDKYPKVRFVMAGSGDMMPRMIELAANLKIGRHVTFTGFLRGDDVDRIFRMADLYVMPSVSEPFGIAPLEALSRNVPVIISRQSGVSEVLTHALKVDFWDIDEMANKMLGVLRHRPLQSALGQYGQIEVRRMTWRDSAAKLKQIYEGLVTPAL